MEELFPSVEEYDPGFTKEKWLELLNNPEIIGPVYGGTLAAFYEIGGAATCTQIAQRYNTDQNIYKKLIKGQATALSKASSDRGENAGSGRKTPN